MQLKDPGSAAGGVAPVIASASPSTSVSFARGSIVTSGPPTVATSRSARATAVRLTGVTVIVTRTFQVPAAPCSA